MELQIGEMFLVHKTYRITGKVQADYVWCHSREFGKVA